MSNSENNKKGLYTVIYPFMARELKLSGLAKECFAILFGFWFSQGPETVSVSLTPMQIITGGTRPAIVMAVKKLEEIGIVRAERMPGKKTCYDIKLADQTLTNFKELYLKQKLVNSFTPQEFIPITSACNNNLPHKIRNMKYETVTSPLKVRAANEIHSGGLTEA